MKLICVALLGARAVLATDIDLATCAAEVGAGCPSFVLAEAADMKKTCSEVGGTLVPAGEPLFWQLDVDADGRNEYLVDLTENLACSAAASIFSCGSLGCPYILYRERHGGWAAVGYVDARDAPRIEVLAGSAGPATLRGGCFGVTPCDELTSYTWTGAAYEASVIEVRGQRVAVAPDGLWTLTRDIAVLAVPETGAATLGEYPAGADVVVLGDAADPAYKFISPCNACASGFVPADALRKWDAGRP